MDDLVLDGAGQRHGRRVAHEAARAIADLASRAQFQYGRTIAGRGACMKPKSEVDPETGAMDPDSTEAHACTVAEVEVDTETGEVAVLSIRSAYEVGRQVNPALVQGQIVGGAWMGMSHALYETTEPYYPGPRPQPQGLRGVPDARPGRAAASSSASSSRCRRPTGPYGVKGVGEMTANSPIPAIVNAIYDACGVRVDSLPVTPEKILRGPRRASPPPRRREHRMSQITTWDEFPTVEYVKGVYRQTVSGEKVMMTRIVYRDGVIIPEHSHEAEQIMLVESRPAVGEGRRRGAGGRARAACWSSRPTGSTPSASWATRTSCSTSASRRSGWSTWSASRGRIRRSR